jgi:hypothetical protein
MTEKLGSAIRAILDDVSDVDKVIDLSHALLKDPELSDFKAHVAMLTAEAMHNRAGEMLQRAQTVANECDAKVADTTADLLRLEARVRQLETFGEPATGEEG